MAVNSRRIPIRYVCLLIEILRERGFDPAPLLHDSGINPVLIDDRDGTATAEQVDHLVCAAQRVSGCDDLGFEVGRRIKVNSHALLGYGLLSVATFDEFMAMASRHYHLMTESWVLSYRRWYSGGEAVYTPVSSMRPETMAFYLDMLALAHQNQINLLFGGKAPGYDIYISMKAPANLNRYQALAPVRFHFNENAPLGVRVLMGADLLNHPLQFSNPAVVQQVDEQCNSMAKRPTKSDIGWVEYLVMLLRQTNGEQVTLEDMARQIKVSSRTIDRHLKKEGLGFRQLSNKVRFERAGEMLSCEGLSITEVALKLGFSDTANFSRAFRREMGVSPSEFQRNVASVTDNPSILST